MKILFLDDDKLRHEYIESIFKDIDQELTHVWNFDECVSALHNNEYDIVYLDHDLNFFVEGVKGRLVELTGYDVAKWIVMHLTYKPRIIVHSWNPVGADNMYTLLHDNGFNVVKRPFKIQ